MNNQWITNNTAVPYYARRTFEIDKRVRTAEARVCGLGQFHFYLNGEKVSDHELDPAWTEYDRQVRYVRFDVTDRLTVGRNAMGAEVGNGWYIKSDTYYTFAFPPFMPPNPNPYRPFGKALPLWIRLDLEYEDGTRETIETDDRFRTAPHPVIMTNVYGSEIIDGRLSQPGWSRADFNDALWQSASLLGPADVPKGRLKEQTQPPVRVLRTCAGKRIGQVQNAETGRVREIFDFGENMSGILSFEVQGKAGDVLQIFPAEKLAADGDVDQVAKGWCTVNSCVAYTIGVDDLPEQVRMKFTYFAGRYVGVEAISARAGGPRPRLLDLKADAISSAWEDAGSFTCDDERYMQIYAMIRRTVEANMLGVHTDCPTIERFAWQEPNHLMAPSIFYMKNGRLLWQKFLEDLRLSQHTADDWFWDLAGQRYYPGDGLVPAQSPCYIHNVLPVPGMGSFYDIIPWGSTCILGVYWHYLFYGDRTILEENYETGVRYLAYLRTKMTPDGFIAHGLGDWGNPQHEFARENIETAFLYADACVLGEFAEILERAEDAGAFRSFAEQVKNNYNEKLMVRHPQTGLWCYRCFDHPGGICLTQAAQALPLYWGMVPDARVGEVTESLRYVLTQQNALICGEIGLPYVIQAARAGGMNDLICSFILKKEHPSYYAFILDGETTLGEYWETNPRSHCHDMMGHIIEWYYNGLAGIIPTKPGFESVLIRPFLPDSIHELRCCYRCPKGEIRIHVREIEEEIQVELHVPEAVCAERDYSQLARKGRIIHEIYQ